MFSYFSGGAGLVWCNCTMYVFCYMPNAHIHVAIQLRNELFLFKVAVNDCSVLLIYLSNLVLLQLSLWDKKYNFFFSSPMPQTLLLQPL